MKRLRLLFVLVLSFGFTFATTNQTAVIKTATSSTSTSSQSTTSAKSKPKTTVSPSAKSSTLSTVQQYQRPKAQYLFVLQANTAKITRGQGGFILTLKDTDPDLLFFTDRPVRKTGLLDANAFLEAWSAKNSSFQLDPPHVALIYTELKKDKNSVRDGIDVKLLNPVALGHRSYSFNLTDLDGTVVSGTYHKVSIIIDYRINN